MVETSRSFGPLPFAETEELWARRYALSEALVRDGIIRSAPVLDAFRAVPRHLFVPQAALELAYVDHALHIGRGQTISQPTIVAMMTEGLELTGKERVLEIGTGSGYQAAILSQLAREVYTMERIEHLAEEASRRLRALGITNVTVRVGDGFEGWPEAAPFDRIVVTAAPIKVPPALLEQLGPSGILLSPVGTQAGFDQQLIRLERKGGTFVPETLSDVAFVPMLHGTEP
jgi:protein-L-isoaspartate(D-aspartate) O-methyltransferase